MTPCGSPYPFGEVDGGMGLWEAGRKREDGREGELWLTFKMNSKYKIKKKAKLNPRQPILLQHLRFKLGYHAPNYIF